MAIQHQNVFWDREEIPVYFFHGDDISYFSSRVLLGLFLVWRGRLNISYKEVSTMKIQTHTWGSKVLKITIYIEKQGWGKKEGSEVKRMKEKLNQSLNLWALALS